MNELKRVANGIEDVAWQLAPCSEPTCYLGHQSGGCIQLAAGALLLSTEPLTVSLLPSSLFAIGVGVALVHSSLQRYLYLVTGWRLLVAIGGVRGRGVLYLVCQTVQHLALGLCLVLLDARRDDCAVCMGIIKDASRT